MRDIQTFDQVHVLSGWRRWDGMIRWEILKNLTKFTYILEMDEEDRMIRWEIFKQLTKFTYNLETDREDGMGWSDEILKQLTKFTYSLETDEENGMGWSDERCSNNWPSSRTLWWRMKRVGWDDQMRDIQTIDQVHILTGDRWRRWDGMIRWEILKQLTKFTYELETDEEDGMGRSDERYSNNWPSSRTPWRRMKGMGWDDQMRDIQRIDQVHVLSGDGWRGWDGMIRWEIFKQLTKFTYSLETDEEDGMGWSDERYSNNWPSSRTFWRRMKGMDGMIRWEILKQLTKFTYCLETDEGDGWDDQMRDIKTIDQVHVRSGDRWRGWDGMIRWEISKQLTKFTYSLETDEENGMGWSDERYSNNWPSSRTPWRRMKKMGWDDQMRDIKTIDQVHVLPGDGWRGWDGMIRWEILKQLTKFTYCLETDEGDGMGLSDERYSNNWPLASSRTLWRRMKGMGWDDQMRDIQTIDQVHILTRDRWRGWDGMIRWDILKQLTKFTYCLETDEGDGMGWSDERYSNNWPSSHTAWRRMKGMGLRDIKTID